MKNKQSSLIQLLILLALGGAVLLAVLLPRLPARQGTPAPVEISVLLRDTDSALWFNTRLGMEQAAAESGAELRILTLAETNDSEDQWAVLRREVDRPADVLVIAPADSAGLAQSLQRQAAGCPIVSLESPLEGAAFTAAPDNEAIGRELAAAALADSGEGTLLLINASPRSAGVSARADSARQAIAQAGAAVRYATVDLARQGSALEALLRQPGLAAVLVFEPALTEQAAAAKERLELTVPLYGVGVTANVAAWLEQGVVSAAAAWSDFAAGYLAVEGAVSLVQGNKYPIQAIPFFIVRGEDIYEPEYQKLLFPVTA